MPRLPERLQREAFKRTRLAEANARGVVSMQLDIEGVDRALRQAQAVVGEAAAQVPQLASQRLSQEIRADRSEWPVWTGYSRSRFRGDERGIINDASYAPKVEFEGTSKTPSGRATKYVNENIERVAEDIVLEIVGED